MDVSLLVSAIVVFIISVITGSVQAVFHRAVVMNSNGLFDDHGNSLWLKFAFKKPKLFLILISTVNFIAIGLFAILATSFVLSFSFVITFPQVALLSLGISLGAAVLGNMLVKLFSSGQVKNLLNEEESVVALEEDEKEMIQSIFSFHGTAVKEIMIPRIDMVALDSQTIASDAVKIVVECRHSRIPVYEGNVDKIIGLLYSKDLLPLVDDALTPVTSTAVADIIRPAYFIPESKKIDQVLEEFRSSKIHMAVVVDEYGGTAGLVTLEDVLEEIVGEIEDEFDDQKPLYKWIDKCSIQVDPKIDLEDLQDIVGVEFELDGSETLAGLVYEAGGKVPKNGDMVKISGLDVLVKSVEDQRILLVVIRSEKELPGYSRQKMEESDSE